MRAFLATMTLIAAASGCVLGEVDHTGQPCPCAPGWTCTDAGICVQGDAGTVMRDAAIPDAPAPDVPRVDASFETCAAGLVFCDGFEDGDAFVSRGPWSLIVRDPDMLDAVMPTMDNARTGAWKLFTGTAAPGRQAALSGQWLEGIAAGELWARAWLYVPSGQSIDGFLPFSVGSADTGWVSAQLGPETEVKLLIGASATADRFAAIAAYPTDRWFCVRVHVTIDDVDGMAELYLDSETPVATSGVGYDTRPTGDFHQVLVGVVYSFPTQGPMHLYVDDVVVDTMEVGCE